MSVRSTGGAAGLGSGAASTAGAGGAAQIWAGSGFRFDAANDITVAAGAQMYKIVEAQGGAGGAASGAGIAASGEIRRAARRDRGSPQVYNSVGRGQFKNIKKH